VDGADSESHPMVDFGISGVKLSGSLTIQHQKGAVNFICCSLQATVSSGSMRAYILEPSGPGGHLLIHSIQADGVTHLQHPNLYFLQSR
jgi:hypothetical protein